jgi:hypothetical protein
LQSLLVVRLEHEDYAAYALVGLDGIISDCPDLQRLSQDIERGSDAIDLGCVTRIEQAVYMLPRAACPWEGLCCASG